MTDPVAETMPNETHDWSDVRDRMRKLADRGFPDAWMPKEPGEDLLAVVTKIKPVVRTAYGPTPVIEVEDPDTHTPWSIWLVHTVLRREMMRLRPAVGELLYVRYEGLVRPDGGGPAYESYTLLIDRPEGGSGDWAEITRRYGHDEDPDDTPEQPEPEQPAAPYVPDDDIPF